MNRFLGGSSGNKRKKRKESASSSSSNPGGGGNNNSSTKHKNKNNASNNASTSMDPFILMNRILDNLLLLEYQNRFFVDMKTQFQISFFPLYPSYFAYQTNIGEQFEYFTYLSVWLLQTQTQSELGFAVDDINIQDPNSLCNNILLECKKLGMNTNFPATKLRTGSGLQCCLILHFLSKLRLSQNLSLQLSGDNSNNNESTKSNTHHANKEPVYHKMKDTSVAKSGLQQKSKTQTQRTTNDEIGIESEIVSDSDSDLHSSSSSMQVLGQEDKQSNKYTHNERNAGAGVGGMDENNDSDTELEIGGGFGGHHDGKNTKMALLPKIVSQINANEWKLELEMAASALKNNNIMMNNNNMNAQQKDLELAIIQNQHKREYISHMAKIQKHSKILNAFVDSSHNSGDNNINQKNKTIGAASATTTMTTMSKTSNKVNESSKKDKLLKHSSKLKQLLSNIELKEKYLQNTFGELQDEYSLAYENLYGVLTKKNQTLVTKVSQLSKDLNDTNANIARIKHQMKNKNETILDQTPVKKVQTNIQTLKQELIQIDLKIGINRQQLNQYRTKYG